MSRPTARPPCVRISKEIVEFASGKADDYRWDNAKVSAALTSEQREILEKRGALSPEEIHRLASKTRKAVGATQGKAACHSDDSDEKSARSLQESLPIQQ